MRTGNPARSAIARAAAYWKNWCPRPPLTLTMIEPRARCSALWAILTSELATFVNASA